MTLQLSIILVFANLILIQTYTLDFDSSPYDLIDDARSELEKLRATVLGAIQSADNNLDDLSTDFQSYLLQVENKGTLSIEQEKTTIDSMLTTLKNLGESLNVDISHCLSGREDNLNNLPIDVLDDLKTCIFIEGMGGVNVLADSKYLVDITINAVDSLEFHLGLCDVNSEVCINPLLERIELEREQIPQNINVEVLKVTELLDELKVILEECSDQNISHYVISANSIIRDMSECIDDIVS